MNCVKYPQIVVCSIKFTSIHHISSLILSFKRNSSTNLFYIIFFKLSSKSKVKLDMKKTFPKNDKLTK